MFMGYSILPKTTGVLISP